MPRLRPLPEPKNPLRSKVARQNRSGTGTPFNPKADISKGLGRRISGSDPERAPRWNFPAAEYTPQAMDRRNSTRRRQSRK